MRPFAFETAGNLTQAIRLGADTGQGQTDANTQFLAGGTTLVDLMRLDVLRPHRVVNLGALRRSMDEIQVGADGLALGALCRMSAVADHPDVVKLYPMVAQSLQAAASAQIRNMATVGGNLLQRTRCPYFRDTRWSSCNKRIPGSGCAAIAGFNRNHAVLGVDQTCIAQYPGDFATALIALDAQLELHGPQGVRRIPLAQLHRPADGKPHIETTLNSGELVTQIFVPAGEWNRCSVYVKVRDRASYEFAIASAAVALAMQGDRVREARLALGGMAYRPWRAAEAEAVLIGKALNEDTAQAAADEALKGAQTHGYNDYKPELARRTLVRALLEAKALSSQGAPS
jgi:xanthine dehydrogenase YagS FAD-binding subunit